MTTTPTTTSTSPNGSLEKGKGLASHHPDETTYSNACQYCCCGWHEGHNVQIIANPASGRGLSIVCNDCRQVADVEGIAHRLRNPDNSVNRYDYKHVLHGVTEGEQGGIRGGQQWQTR